MCYKKRSFTKHFVLDDHRCRGTFGYCKTGCGAKIKHGWVSIVGWSGLLDSDLIGQEQESVLHIIVVVSLVPSLFDKGGEDYLNWFLEKFKNQEDYTCRLYELCRKMIRLESSSYSSIGKLNLFMTETVVLHDHRQSQFNPEVYIKDLASVLDKRIQKIRRMKFRI